MPRGFLVKRNKKPNPVSYRVRSDEEDAEQADSPPSSSISVLSSSSSILSSSASVPVSAPAPGPGRSQTPSPSCGAAAPDSDLRPVQFGDPEAVFGGVYSPTRPGPALDPGCRLGSPASAASFPGLEQLLGPVDLKVCSRTTSRTSSASSASASSSSRTETSNKRPNSDSRSKASSSSSSSKRTKAVRRLQFLDQVTTSPVLGLRIKEEQEEAQAGGGGAGGAFICQLCREGYPDPLSLAQHRCSRIVRVEYRCPDCSKVFSCPANLASHRRWHKPRGTQRGAGGGAGGGAEEASSGRDTPSPGASSSSSSSSGSDEGLFDCSSCSRRFKRRSFLRRHQETQHGAPAPQKEEEEEQEEEQQSPAPLNLSGASSSSSGLRCPVCGDSSSSRGAQERHLRLAHSSQVFPCKYCSSVLFSSPGLTRHINKCHPSENRQVILLQVPLRPAC